MSSMLHSSYCGRNTEHLVFRAYVWKYTQLFCCGGGVVHVLHSGGNHWLTVSSIGCPYSSVKVYDSLYTHLPPSTKEEICSLLESTEPVIHVDFVNTQLQANGVDCGLFALAFCAALCEGQNPQELQFNCSAMRSHVLTCLEKGEMTTFPCHRVKRMQKIKAKETIRIYCKCRTQEGGECGMCIVPGMVP